MKNRTGIPIATIKANEVKISAGSEEYTELEAAVHGTSLEEIKTWINVAKQAKNRRIPSILQWQPREYKNVGEFFAE